MYLKIFRIFSKQTYFLRPYPHWHHRWGPELKQICTLWRKHDFDKRLRLSSSEQFEVRMEVGTEKIGLLTENPENLEVHFLLKVFVLS